MSDGSTLKVYCDMHNGTWCIDTGYGMIYSKTVCIDTGYGMIYSKTVCICRRVDARHQYQGSAKQNTYAITGALNAGKFDKKSSYKLTDKQINEIAADAGTKDFLLICSDEVEFGKFRSFCPLFGLWMYMGGVLSDGRTGRAF